MHVLRLPRVVQRWKDLSRRRKWLTSGIATILGFIAILLAHQWWTSWSYRLLLENPGGHYPVTFSRDGSTLVTRSGSTGETFLWDTRSGEKRATWKSPANQVRGLGSFSGDDRTYACLLSTVKGQNHQIELIDVASGMRRVLVNPPRSNIHVRSFLDDGQTFRLVVGDQVAREVVDVDLLTGQIRSIRPLSAPMAYRSWWVSENGRRMVILGSSSPGKLVDSVKVWDLDSDSEFWALSDLPGTSPLEFAQLSTDGKSLAIARNDGSIEAWDMTSSSLRNRFQAHSPGFRPQVLWVSPDGSKVASWGVMVRMAFSIDMIRFVTKGVVKNSNPNIHEIVVFDLTTGRRLGRTEAEGQAVAFTIDGKTMATPADEGTRVRDLPGSR